MHPFEYRQSTHDGGGRGTHTQYTRFGDKISRNENLCEWFVSSPAPAPNTQHLRVVTLDDARKKKNTTTTA